MADDEQEPVAAGLGGREDLYDVATWEPRTRLDGFVVRLTKALRRARTWLLIVLAFALFLGEIAVAGLLVVERPVLGLLALGSIVPALLLAGYFWYGDPTRREPVETLAITFILGVLFATFAALVNSSFSPAFGLLGEFALPFFFFLVVAPIEETVKWAAVRIHAYKTESFDAVIDGVVYGAVAGLGFAAIENLIYIVNIYMLSAETGAAASLGDVTQLAWLRAFVGPGHVIYSSFAGYYLGLAKFNPDNRGPIVVKGLVIAVFIHATYNTLVSTLPLTSNLSMAGFLILYDGFWLAILYRKISRYKRYYTRAQASVAPAGGPRQVEDETGSGDATAFDEAQFDDDADVDARADDETTSE